MSEQTTIEEPTQAEVRANFIATQARAIGQALGIDDSSLGAALLVEGGALIAFADGRADAVACLRRVADLMEAGTHGAAGSA